MLCVVKVFCHRLKKLFIIIWFIFVFIFIFFIEISMLPRRVTIVSKIYIEWLTLVKIFLRFFYFTCLFSFIKWSWL